MDFHDANQFLPVALLVLGGISALWGGVLCAAPAVCRRGLTAYPRLKVSGWMLTAVCVCWVAWMAAHTELGRFAFLRPWIPVLGIILFAAVVWAMDELLSARALGALMTLLADPLLDGVRWADSAWRLVVAVTAYAWVLAGCGLMLYPWGFRKVCGRIAATDGRCRVWGGLQLVAGAVLLAAGWSLRS